MNVRKSLLSTVGVVAMVGGMFSGMVGAAPVDSDTDDAVLVVGCAPTQTVDVDVVGKFRVDTSVPSPFYSAELPDGFRITLDLTCNWSNDFQVSAEIGTFQYDGVAPGAAADSFSGAHLLLTNGSGTYNGPTMVGAGAPNIEATVFELLQTNDPDAIENATGWGWVYIPWLDTSIALPGQQIVSPGVTVATWDGHLNLLPNNLANGEYIAPLTVELTVN